MFLHDNGLKSRKLWLDIFAMCLVVVGGGLCIHFPSFIPAYATYCGTLVALYGLYFGSNVTEKHILGKQEIARATLEQQKTTKPASDDQNG